MTVLEAIAADLRQLEDKYVEEVEQRGQVFPRFLDEARSELLRAVQLRDAYQRASIVFAPFVNPTTAATTTWPPAAPPPGPPVKITFEQ